MTFFESSSRSIFLCEYDLSGKPVPTFPDHALGRKGTPLWLNSRAVDDLEISAAAKRVKFPSGPQRAWADRISHDLPEADRRQLDDFRQTETATVSVGAILNRSPQLLIDHDEISRRPRTGAIDQDGIAGVRQPGAQQIPGMINCQRVGISAYPVVGHTEEVIQSVVPDDRRVGHFEP